MLCVSCGAPNSPFQDNPLGAAPGTHPVKMPPAVHMHVAGFAVDLDPTVELWGKQAHVDVTGVVRTAVTHIEGLLHGTPAPVSVEAGTYHVIPAVGIGGYTDPYTGRVQISMDQRAPLGLKVLLGTWLPLSLAHELHHAARILDGAGYGTTVEQAVVSEGAAEAFVREAYPSAPPIPWVQPLSSAEEIAVRTKLSQDASIPDTPDLHEDWFFGQNGLPRWAGYRIGYAMSERYLSQHPAMTAADLVRVPAADVVAAFS